MLTEPIVIWGAGAMGGTIGAHLVRAGYIVRFVDIVPDHVLAMRAGGLRVTGPVADFRVDADAVLPGDLAARISTVLLCVKAHHTAGAVRMLAPRLSPDGVVVSVQNGLNETVIAAAVGTTRTFGCFVNFGADYIEPGLIHYGGRGTVAVGELDGHATPRSAAIHSLFHSFDERAILSDNIFGYLWSKLAYASMLFATALSDEGIADALDRPQHRPLYAALAHEVVRVATAEGIRLEPFDGFEPRAYANPVETRPEATESRSGNSARWGAMTAEAMESLNALVAHNRRSAKVHSGIWRDLAIRRRPTEVDAQLGPVVDAAARHGIATPLNRRLIAMIHEVERGERRQTHINLDELSGARLQPDRGSRSDGFGGTRAEAGGPTGGDS